MKASIRKFSIGDKVLTPDKVLAEVVDVLEDGEDERVKVRFLPGESLATYSAHELAREKEED